MSEYINHFGSFLICKSDDLFYILDYDDSAAFEPMLFIDDLTAGLAYRITVGGFLTRLFFQLRRLCGAFSGKRAFLGISAATLTILAVQGKDYNMAFSVPVIISIILLFLVFFTFITFLIIKVGAAESPQRRAGRLGEKVATTIIREVLNDDDTLFTNVEIFADGKQTELDNLVINSHGIYIFEVKNYSGELYGTKEDYEWLQSKMTPGGNFHQKNVKNPIKQVNRQVYILSRFLKENGIDAWVEGYVILLEHNSPVADSCILNTQKEIAYAIHTDSKKKFNKKTKDAILALMNDSEQIG